MPSETIKEVFNDLSPVIKVYKDGTVERLMGSPNVPPSPEDPTSGVASKDIAISPVVKARLYLPKLTDPNQKLPVLIYYHGGGFVIESPYCLVSHRLSDIFAAEAKALIISVQYRLAPEHLLPIAYEDSWTALRWVASHVIANAASIEKDPWVTKHADFGKLYIGGDSAGANIAHNIALRAGVEPLPGDVKILGLFLSCPYFWGSKLVGSQSKEGKTGFAYRVWMCIYPSAPGGIDNPMINPFAVDAPSLSGLACSRLLVCLPEKDAFTPMGILYAETVKKSSWKGEVKLVVVDGEDHCFHLFDPYTEKAKDLIKQLTSFISR